MLNENLMDSKDIIIAKLKLAIKEFQEYDIERKYPLADFILKDDGAWEDFVDFFTSEKETASGTPYIDCYDIRELFENGDV